MRSLSPNPHGGTCVCCDAISWAGAGKRDLELCGSWAGVLMPVTDTFWSVQHAIDAMSAGVSPSRNTSYNSSYWDVGSAFFFAGTVITTIGNAFRWDDGWFWIMYLYFPCHHILQDNLHAFIRVASLLILVLSLSSHTDLIDSIYSDCYIPDQFLTPDLFFPSLPLRQQLTEWALEKT